MRIVIVGQQEFGKAVLEAFMARGDEVVGVFSAPEKANAKPDPLSIAAKENHVPVYQMASLAGDEAKEVMQGLKADIGVMAYVTQFVSEDLARIPKHGTIQYHPSLLPKYRGPSAINWAIACGEKETGITIFRPTEGIDEGEVILQKTAPILPDDTLGSLYFDKLFPIGVEALLEAADLVVSGKHTEIKQDETQANYMGWFRENESKINWNNHVDFIYNLIRASNPRPGAWTTWQGNKVEIYEANKHLFRGLRDIKGAVGTISEIDENSFSIVAQGGKIEVLRVSHEKGKRIPATDFIRTLDLKTGAKLGE